jgi:PAS domain S-box-containing protein
VKKIINFFRLSIERFLSKLGLGMRAKLIIIFVIIKVIPLVLLSILAWRQARSLGAELGRRTEELTANANEALVKTGALAVDDSVKALNENAVEEIERMSTDMANRVTDFLYERDRDILFAAGLEPDEGLYRRFIESKTGRVVKPGTWELAPDGKSWIRADPPPEPVRVASSNSENDNGFHYRPPDGFDLEDRPLYLEMTFIGLDGNEQIKVTGSPRMDKRLKNISQRRNTYVRAETYWPELLRLKPGEIYVSDVIGAYVPSRLIGMYTPENAASRGLEFTPETEAYAGRENPLGKRFQGIVRWAAPVVREGAVIGFVSFALDHDHIMEFTDHATPMGERYTELPSAYEGNYAFIWDYQCRSICHPRHHSIVGFNPETGEPEVPWLEQSIYDDWRASGKKYADFIKDVPVFAAQSRDKKPAAALTEAGLVGLDGRYLNNAPQCTGWFDLTREGGSGSFLILWSGIWKPNTAAAIPYYTGQYGASKRGFGFVAVGAGLEDFQRPARETEGILNSLIAASNNDLTRMAGDARDSIARNLLNTTVKLAASAGVMIILVILIAIWMASAFTQSITAMINGISRFRSGERQFRFNAVVKDEMGILADSFDDMADSLIEGVKNPLVITDMEEKIKYANEEALKGIGKTLPDILGRPYREVSYYHGDAKYDPITALKEGRESEVMYTGESGRYVRGSAAYLTDKGGENIGYVISTTDLTEIIEEQKKITEQKILLDMIFASSPDLIWYQDSEDRLLAVNPRYAALSGRKSEELIGLDAKSLIPPDFEEAFKENNRKAVESGKPYYVEEKITFADGHEEILDTVLTPLFDAGGGYTGLLGFGRDVSARVSIENELRTTQLKLEKAVEEANQANQHKGNFLARMSHEIRTPMNAIIGMTNIVKKQLEEEGYTLEEVKNNLRQIEASSQHLLGLLNDILDISKIEAGKIELSEEPVDMIKLARTVESIIRPRCTEKSIAFNTGFTLPPPAVFTGDSLRLRQILINLLGNAVKFTPEGGVIDFTITQVESREGKALLSFIIRDSGIGISDEAMGSLFKPFEQASGHITKQYGGTGLGLAISRSIVMLFGGDITVRSKIGEGSVFSFSIWLPESDAVSEETDMLNTADCLAGKRALLADDVDINRIIAVNMLEYTGMAIDEAGDGLAAVRMFGDSPENTYDIIYMDIQMPNMDGYEAAAAIRGMDRSDAGKIPIVALTANAFKEDIDKSAACGMNAHLAKPIDESKLLEVTFRLLHIS